MDTQYRIDIAAHLDGRETEAELDTLARSIAGVERGAASYQATLRKLDADLASSARAVKESAAALAESRAEYTALEREALRAAKAEERASARGAQGDELAALQRATDEAREALDAHAKQLVDVEDRAARAAAEHERLTHALTGVETLSKAADRALKQQADAERDVAREAKRFADEQKRAAREAYSKQIQAHDKLAATLSNAGPFGRAAAGLVNTRKRYLELSDAIGASRALAITAAAGFASLAAAAVAVGVAAGAAVAGLVAFGVAQQDAARSAALTAEATEFFTPALAGVRDEIAALSDEYQLSTAQLQGFAKQLLDAKVSADDLPAALEAVAIAETAMAGGAGEFVAAVREGDRAVQDLARDAKTQLGGVAAKQLLSLDKIGAKFSKSISGLFDDLNIEPVLEGLNRLAGMFGKNTELGQTLRWAFSEIFQPLLDGAPNAAVAIERFFLETAIAGLEWYLELRKYSEQFIAAWEAVKAYLGALQAYWGFLWDWFTFGPKVLFALLSGAGSDAVAGLVQGVIDSGGKFVEALKNLALKGLEAVKSVLGIHSPSTEFAFAGKMVGAGMVEGVEDSTPDVRDAFDRMASPESAQSTAASAGASAAGASGGAARVINVAAGAVVISGVSGAAEALEQFEAALTRVIEGDALAVGAAAA